MAYFLAFELFCFHVAFIHIKTGGNWRVTNGRGARPALVNRKNRLSKTCSDFLFLYFQINDTLIIIKLNKRKKMLNN